MGAWAGVEHEGDTELRHLVCRISRLTTSLLSGQDAKKWLDQQGLFHSLGIKGETLLARHLAAFRMLSNGKASQHGSKESSA